MRKFKTLTLVLFKSTLGGENSNSKTWKMILLYILLGICFIPLIFVFYFMFDVGFQAIEILDQDASLLAAGFHISNMITFLFSFFIIPSIYYFGKDIEALLSMPLTPRQIMSSKFLVCLAYEYIFSSFVLLPLFAAYIENASISFIGLLAIIIAFIIMPIYPLVISSIITMLLMRFVPFFNNKDRFQMIAGIVGILTGFSISFFSQNLSINGDQAMDLIMSILDGDNSLLSIFSKLFPYIPFLSKGIHYGSIIDLLIALLIIGASLVVLIFVAQKVYLQGALDSNNASTSKKRISSKELTSKTGAKPVMLTYFKKDLTILVKTPAFLLNCVLSSIMIPIFLGISLFMIRKDIDLSIFSMFDLNEYLPQIIFIGLIAGILCSSLSMVSCSSISREGANIYFMKIIPVPLGKQIISKLFVGYMFSLISIILTLGVFTIFLPIVTIQLFIIIFITASISSLLTNLMMIIIDMFKPKLVWEQEAIAVKQNFSSIVSMLLAFAITACLGIILYNLSSSLVLPVGIILTVGMLVANIILIIKIDKIANHFFQNY